MNSDAPTGFSLTSVSQSGSGRPALTLESAIRQCAAAFEAAGLHFGHGTDNALDEASWLVLHAVGLSPAEPPDYARVLDADAQRDIEALATRRIQEQRPAAYLTGCCWFAGIELGCDERALVPRSPLAELITDDFFDLLPAPPARILDLCTGGGCIAIACALYHPASQVDASDLSPDALALAGENVARYALQDRVRLLQGSLFEPVDGPYDLILSNPPYVDADDIRDMPDEFRHEPMLGLAAGADGLDLVRVMLARAADYLTPGGVLVVEVGNSAAALEAAYPELPFLWLTFSAGGQGVFALTREELIDGLRG